MKNGVALTPLLFPKVMATGDTLADGFHDQNMNDPLPGDPTRHYTRIRQEQADQAFKDGDYEHSYRVYRKMLVPKGDIRHVESILYGCPRCPISVEFALARTRVSSGAPVE
jgi:hypothetical protein